MCILLISVSAPIALCQKLSVKKSDANRVYRDMKQDHALVIFETNLKDLVITPTITRENIVEEEHHGLKVYFIETDLKPNMHGVYNDRVYLLRSHESEEYVLEVEDMMPKNVYFYTVALHTQYPLTYSFEYVFDMSSKNAIRLAAGRRLGGYVCYKWGDYYPAGVNIDEYQQNADVSFAECLGGIRTGITGGLRLGLVCKSIPTYLYIGGGYGIYGRQWRNKHEVSDNIYFHSDYIRGCEGEVGLSFILLNILSLSIGADMIVGGGRITTDFQIGVGLTINQSKMRKVIYL